METNDLDNSSCATIPYSDEFNDESAEITYQSSDGIRFRIHVIFLKAHSEVLAPEKGSTFEEIVHLTESSDILQLLFGFIYPTRQAILDTNISFLTVRALAEASEKYRVFPAMYACYLHMQSVSPDNALYTLGFALKHGYIDLVDLASPHVIDRPIPEILEHIPSHSYKPWFTYHKKWIEIQTRALTTHLQAYRPPISDISCVVENLTALTRAAANISATATVTSSGGRHKKKSCSVSGKDGWWMAIDTEVKAVRKLSTFISPSASFDHAADSLHSQEDGGVVIQTTDGVQYKIHHDIIRNCAKGFGDPVEGIIQVPEKASAICLLLKFIQPVRSPNLQTLSFENLYELICAAEKYSVQQAIGICRYFIKKHLSSHPAELFDYAAKWNQPDILDLAAPLILNSLRPYDQTFMTLPASLMVPWACYFQKWQDIAKTVLMEAVSTDFTRDKESDNRLCHPKNDVSAVSTSGWGFDERKPEYNMCCNESNFVHSHLTKVISQLCEGPGALRDLEKLFPVDQACSRAEYRFRRCREMAKKAVEEIPILSKLINH